MSGLDNSVRQDEQVQQFSYHNILVDEVLSIPENQHMITTSLVVDGFVDLDGGIVIL